MCFPWEAQAKGEYFLAMLSYRTLSHDKKSQIIFFHLSQRN